MSYWTQLFANTNTPQPWPAFFSPYGLPASVAGGEAAFSGVMVSPDTALRLSTVFACVRLLSETIASLPLAVYQKASDGSRQEAPNHPLYDLLHDQPNPRQTSVEFRQMMMSHLLLRGNAYGQIKAGARGPVDQLEPLYPDIVLPELLPDGSLRYRVNGAATLNDDQMLHLKGMSFDGRVGVSPITYMRETIGLGLAAERYASRFFGNGAVTQGLLKRPADKKALSDVAFKRLQDQFDAAHTGPNQHKTVILEEGTEYQAISLTNEQSQFIESREFSAEDIAGRWFGVPPHMVGLTSKATSWGTGIEQMGIGFVVYTLLPWLTRWEQAITRDLILNPRQYFVAHDVSGLLRGDIAARGAWYQIGRNIGVLSANDIRRQENLNPRPDPDGDAYWQPLNMESVGAPGQTRPSVPPQPAQPPAAPGRPSAFAQDAAARTARREAAELGKRVKRGADWAQAVDDFYAEWPGTVAELMHCDLPSAQTYADYQRRACQTLGPDYLASLEQKGLEALLAMTQEVA